MHGKEFAIDLIRTFFTVVTLVNVAMLVLGTWLTPDMKFGYEAFCAPLIYGVVGTLPNIVMYSRRELTVKELLFRKMLEFILVEVLVLGVAFYGTDTFWRQPKIAISMGISIFLIYVIASIMDWAQNYVVAKRMTDELVKFQERVDERTDNKISTPN